MGCHILFPSLTGVIRFLIEPKQREDIKIINSEGFRPLQGLFVF